LRKIKLLGPGKRGLQTGGRAEKRRDNEKRGTSPSASEYIEGKGRKRRRSITKGEIIAGSTIYSGRIKRTFMKITGLTKICSGETFGAKVMHRGKKKKQTKEEGGRFAATQLQVRRILLRFTLTDRIGNYPRPMLVKKKKKADPQSGKGVRYPCRIERRSPHLHWSQGEENRCERKDSGTEKEKGQEGEVPSRMEKRGGGGGWGGVGCFGGGGGGG